MKHRYELLQVYCNFAKMVETQFSKCIKIFRSDNTLEYNQYAFQAILNSFGIVHQLTCPSTSQQNGRAKRKLYHILDTVRTLLLSTKVPTLFWGKAALHAVYTINRIPSPVIQNQTPYDLHFGSSPDYHHLRSFSSTCFILLQPHKRNKLEPRSRLCCFLGYDETQKGYQCYDPVSHHFHISRNVLFWEHCLFVELSHFRASLSSSSVLDLFRDEEHIPFVATPDPPTGAPVSPIYFSVQPPDIIDQFPSSPFNEQVEDEQVEDELPNPNPKLRSPAPALPEDLAQDILLRH